MAQMKSEILVSGEYRDHLSDWSGVTLCYIKMLHADGTERKAESAKA